MRTSITAQALLKCLLVSHLILSNQPKHGSASMAKPRVIVGGDHPKVWIQGDVKNRVGGSITA